MNELRQNALVKYLTELAQIRAPSGLEEKRALHFMAQMKQFLPNNVITQDRIGNVIIRISGEPPDSQHSIKKIMLVGHLDEIGATVQKILPNGRILLQKRGGIEPRWLVSEKVNILALDGNYEQGIVLGRTIHAIPPETRTKPLPNINELEVYLGANSAKEIEEAGIHVGAPVVFGGETSLLNPNIDPDLIMSNSLDDLAAMLVMLEIAARLREKKFTIPKGIELFLVAATREEIGREGSLIAARQIQPDYCIGIDFGTIDDSTGSIGCGGSLKGGPMIVWTESQGSGVFHYPLAKSFVDAATQEELPFQHGVMEYYGSDAGIIQKELGIPSILIAPPLMMGHNVPEIMSLGEIGKCADLILAWIRHDFTH
jgi:endoglucanase